MLYVHQPNVWPEKKEVQEPLLLTKYIMTGEKWSDEYVIEETDSK